MMVSLGGAHKNIPMLEQRQSRGARVGTEGFHARDGCHYDSSSSSSSSSEQDTIERRRIVKTLAVFQLE